jgi:hypothetical protein
MVSRLRFFLYRLIVSGFTWLAFRTQKVYPLATPTDGAVRFRPYATAFPGMPVAGIYDPEEFPPSDMAKSRLRGMKVGKVLLGLAAKLPTTTPPVPADEGEFLRVAYPFFFRRAWPRAPHAPRELVAGGSDVLASIAVRGPFASYLRREAPGDVRGANGATADHYVLDLSWMLDYKVRPGLTVPGGIAVLEARDGALRTVAIHRRDDGPIRPGTPDYRSASTALLAAINEDLTTFRHNLSTHLTTLTAFGLASTNRLPAAHPLRRLLHHTFHTVLIGNREVAQFQMSGPSGFSSTIFSHDAPVVAQMASDRLKRFDFWEFEPPTQFARRGTTTTPFAYPYRDNVMRAWAITLAYTTRYVGLYYASDGPLHDDRALAAWIDDLDRLLPNGISRPATGDRREWLARMCATLLHLSSVEHDVLNNVVWDYSTISWVIPTLAPASGAPMDQRRAFDLIATIIGTWKPYNMLLTSNIPSLALDDAGRAAMQQWIDDLTALQKEMDKQPTRPDLTYPRNWNPSISN